MNAWRLLLIVSVSVGCTSEEVIYGEDGNCTTLFEKLRDCDAGFGTPEAPFVDRCQRTRADFRMLMACSMATRCQAFMTCATAARARTEPARRTQRLLKLSEERDDARREGRWRDVVRLCRVMVVDPDPGQAIGPQCTDVPGQAVRALTAELVTLRDNPGGGSAHLDDCADLKYFARKISRTARSLADTLCKEVALSQVGHAAIAEARRRAAADALELPLSCEPAIRRLATLTTPFARELRAKVVTACYAQLGRLILARHTARGTCDVHVRRLLDGIERHTVTDRVAKALAVGLRPVCGSVAPEPDRAAPSTRAP